MRQQKAHSPSVCSSCLMHGSTFIYRYGQRSQGKSVAGKHRDVGSHCAGSPCHTQAVLSFEKTGALFGLEETNLIYTGAQSSRPCPGPAAWQERSKENLLSSKLWCLNFSKGICMAALHFQTSSGREKGVLNMKVYWPASSDSCS